jgi:glucokinase
VNYIAACRKAPLMSTGPGAGFPLLVGDIGGTNARFGWVRDAGAPLSDVIAPALRRISAPEDAARSYLDRHHADARPARAAIAIAGAVSSGPVKVTNSHWTLERDAFARHVGASAVDIFNDFEAIALVLPYLTPSDYRLDRPPRHPTSITPWASSDRAPGWAWAASCRSAERAAAGSPGAVKAATSRSPRRPTTSTRYCSPPGWLTRMCRPSAWSRASGCPRFATPSPKSRAGDRADAGRGGNLHAWCGAHRQAVRAHDGGLLLVPGVRRGNLALTLGARGGLFIAGGIVPRLGDFFMQSAFRSSSSRRGDTWTTCAESARP